MNMSSQPLYKPQFQMQSATSPIDRIFPQQYNAAHYNLLQDQQQDQAYSNNGMEKLMMTNTFFLKPRSDTICEVGQNKTKRIKASKILDVFPDNTETMPCFTVYLKTNCFQKYCLKLFYQFSFKQILSHDCRAFKATVMHSGSKNEGDEFMQLINKCSCCSRQKMEVFCQGDSETMQKVGLITNPCGCFNYQLRGAAFSQNFQITKQFTVESENCPCSFWCPACCNCCGCDKMQFKVHNNQKQQIAAIEKKFQLDICEEAQFVDVYLEIQMPNTPIDRILLLAAAIFLELRYFD